MNRSAGVQSRPKRADVRARIIVAARESFVRQGYQRTNLSEVAARAGFSKGAVYSNFGGKSDLFTAVINEQTSAVTGSVLSSARQLAVAIVEPESVARIAGELTKQVMAGESTLAMLADLRNLAGSDPQLAKLYGQLRAAQRRHLLADLRTRATEFGVDAEFTEGSANLLLTVVQALAIEYAAAPQDLPRELITETLQVAIRGVLR